MNYYDQFTDEEKEELNTIVYLHDCKLDLVNKAIEIYLRHQQEVETNKCIAKSAIPCPFCGSKEIAEQDPGKGNHYMQCLECEAKGPNAYDPCGAWNERFTFIHKEEPGEDFYKPQIIGNVMKWKNENYFILPKNPSENICEGCQFKRGKLCKLRAEYGNKSCNWKYHSIVKNFKDIKITDELATMRTKENPIYVMVNVPVTASMDRTEWSKKPVKLIGVIRYSDTNIAHFTSSGVWDKCRLATYEELEKWLKK